MVLRVLHYLRLNRDDENDRTGLSVHPNAWSKPPGLISLTIQPRKLTLMLCAHTHGSLHSLCLSGLLLRLMLALHLLLLMKGIHYDALVGDLGCLKILIYGISLRQGILQ